MIKEIFDDSVESAICLCFRELVESTCFFKFKNNYDVALKFYIDMALKYHKDNNTNYYGYYIGDKLVGVIELNKNYINQLVVRRDYQGNKIGTELISFVLEQLDTIEVDAFVATVSFYNKFGFETIGNSENRNSIKMIKKNKR